MKTIALAASIMMATGCAGSIHHYKKTCELGTGDLTAEREQELIDNKQVAIGMSLCGLYRVRGGPNQTRSSASKYGQKYQLRYGQYGYGSVRYYYVQDGKVTGWN